MIVPNMIPLYVAAGAASRRRAEAARNRDESVAERWVETPWQFFERYNDWIIIRKDFEFIGIKPKWPKFEAIFLLDDEIDRIASKRTPLCLSVEGIIVVKAYCDLMDRHSL